MKSWRDTRLRHLESEWPPRYFSRRRSQTPGRLTVYTSKTANSARLSCAVKATQDSLTTLTVVFFHLPGFRTAWYRLVPLSYRLGRGIFSKNQSGPCRHLTPFAVATARAPPYAPWPREHFLTLLSGRGKRSAISATRGARMRALWVWIYIMSCGKR